MSGTASIAVGISNDFFIRDWIYCWKMCHYDEKDN